MLQYLVIAVGLLAVFTSLAPAALVGRAEIHRDLQVRNTVLRTASIHNGLTGEDLPVEGEEFRFFIEEIGVLTPAQFEVRSVPSEMAEPIREGRWELRCDRHELEVVVVYETDAAEPWLRKHLEIRNLGSAPRTLRWVEVERMKLGGERVAYSADPAFPTLRDYGQPVLFESMWIGLAHPAANTAAAADGRVTLRHHPGKVLGPRETFVSEVSVMGVAKAGQGRDAFKDYVEKLKYYPGPPRVFYWWNGFRVIKPPNRLKQGLRMVDRLINDLQRPYGHVFDGFSYDAGFAMYREQGLWVPSESRIWERTAEALEPTSTHLGFWASFSCIYDTNTHEWGAKQGYGLQHGRAYCLAEPTYHQAAKERLLEIVEKHDMRVISFDGMHLDQGYGCNTPGHGHLVGEGQEAGKYGTEAVVNASLDVFNALRKIQPEICIDFFVCGEFVSPWWLTVVDGVHSVPGDTIGCDVPSPELRDELITARDIQAFELHRHRRCPFPLWAEDLYGFQVRRDHLIDGVTAVNEDYTAKWENEYVLGFAGRGTITSYIACSDLHLLHGTPTGLKFLAEVSHWVRHNRAIYLNTRFILGEPEKGEVCGYAHGDDEGRCLIALHNCGIDTDTVKLTIDEELDLAPTDKDFEVHVIYPFRASLPAVGWKGEISLPIHGFEVMLLEVRRSDEAKLSFPPPGEWQLDGPAVTDASKRHESGTWQVKAGVKLEPAHRDAEMLVYLRPPKKLEYRIDARINGEKVESTIRSRSRQGREEAWFILPLGQGSNEVELAIPAGADAQVVSWVRCSLPAHNDGAGESRDEPLLPILPDGYRKQYWPAHGVRE